MKNNKYRILIPTVILFIAFSVGILIYLGNRGPNEPQCPSSPEQGSVCYTLQADAIKQAQEYRSGGVCTQALVPAVHKATGAKHTFNTGCLAPGWEPEN